MGKKVCPMLTNDRTGLQRKCLEKDCAWYVDGACAAITNTKKDNHCSKATNDVLVTLAKYPEFREAVGLATKNDAKIKKIIAEYLHSNCEEESLSLSSPPSFPPSPEEYQELLDTLGYAREMWKAAEGEIGMLTKEKEKDKKRISDLENCILQLQRDLADGERKRKHLFRRIKLFEKFLSYNIDTFMRELLIWSRDSYLTRRLLQNPKNFTKRVFFF